jgi:hypothetical protein
MNMRATCKPSVRRIPDVTLKEATSIRRMLTKFAKKSQLEARWGVLKAHLLYQELGDKK